jgi:cytochrome c-type biogenesis protein CcmH/NrfG
MQRNYGGAIQGLQQRIAAGQATGSNYQQLGAAYANVGDTGQAAAAYQNAIAAYRAQIQAGENVDVATRGLRTTQMQLNRLQAR